MKNNVIGIHPVHRKLAQIFEMSTGINGNTVIGAAEWRQIMPLLKQNYELVRQLDELKQLSFVAYELGDHEWLMEISAKIESLEEAMEI